MTLLWIFSAAAALETFWEKGRLKWWLRHSEVSQGKIGSDSYQKGQNCLAVVIFISSFKQFQHLNANAGNYWSRK